MIPTLPPRRVLPRWRKSAVAPNSPESQNGVEQREKSPIDLQVIRAEVLAKLEEWKSEPLPGLAADLVAYSVFPEMRPLIREVAAEVLRSSSTFPPNVVEIAQDSISDSAVIEVPGEIGRAQIAKLRGKLKAYPANPLALMDFALLQASCGNLRAAERAVISATSLAPGHRLILRSAARFHVHSGHPERALHILKRAESLQIDPWLLAAEISVNTVLERKSVHLKKARAWLASLGKPTVHFSELAGAIATELVISGSNKEARRIFNLALTHPTENAVAQAQWAASELSIPFDVREEWLTNQEFHETQCIRGILEGDFARIITSAHTWHMNEPFSSRPLVMASYAHGILGDFEKSVQTARQGLLANPGDLHLMNNLYYALASHGSLAEADEYLRRILKLEKSDPAGHTLANLGHHFLLHGNVESADQFYRSAVAWFQKRHSYDSAANALASYARALFLSGDPKWKAVRVEVEKLPNQTGASAAKAILQSIPDESIAKPLLQAPLRKATGIQQNWVYDKEKNVLVVKARKYL